MIDKQEKKKCRKPKKKTGKRASKGKKEQGGQLFKMSPTQKILLFRLSFALKILFTPTRNQEFEWQRLGLALRWSDETVQRDTQTADCIIASVWRVCVYSIRALTNSGRMSMDGSDQTSKCVRALNKKPPTLSTASMHVTFINEFTGKQAFRSNS